MNGTLQLGTAGQYLLLAASIWNTSYHLRVSGVTSGSCIEIGRADGDAYFAYAFFVETSIKNSVVSMYVDGNNGNYPNVWQIKAIRVNA